MARICRAYNSYHRELHLLISLWEYGMNAHYSLAQDIEKGIDVAITYHGTQYGIRSCIDSEYSNAFCKKKEEGRHLYKNSEIVFPARLRNNAHGPCNVKYVGDAALYRKEAVWDFLSLLEDTSA